MPIDLDATWANAPTDVDPPEYNAADLRRADAGLVAGAGTSFAVRGGIAAHGAASLQVSVDGADAITVQPGAVIIPGDAVSGVGVYRSALPAAHTETLTARHATLSRIDLVVFRMLDEDVVGGHTVRTARIEVLPGTASGSPAVPAKPSMAVELARVTVPATGGGSAVVDLSTRTFTAALGGLLPVASAAVLPGAAAPYQQAVALDTGRRYEWDGAAWWPLYRIQHGQETCPVAAIDTTYTLDVTFDRPFAEVPTVTVTNVGTSVHAIFAGANNFTTTGFRIQYRRSNNTTDMIVNWTAVG